MEYNSTSPAYCANQGGSTQYMVYPFPHHNVTTPNRKRPNMDDTKACKACGSNNTPLWRKGPDGPQVHEYFLKDFIYIVRFSTKI